MGNDNLNIESDTDHRWDSEISGVLHNNPWFSVLLQSVRTPDGKAMSYYTVHHENPSVGIVARKNDQYLLIRQHRFIIDQYVWAIPSGGVDSNESSKDAARRELKEETGCVSNNIKHLLSYFPTYGCSDQRFELFLAEDTQDEHPHFDTNEVIETRWFSRREVINMIAENKIVDGLSLVPLLYVFLFASDQ